MAKNCATEQSNHEYGAIQNVKSRWSLMKCAHFYMQGFNSSVWFNFFGVY